MSKKKLPTWKTKDGREILIRDMDDKHLLNTMRYLERNGAKDHYDMMVIADVEGNTTALKRLTAMSLEEFLFIATPKYKDLLDEFTRRRDALVEKYKPKPKPERKLKLW